MTHKYIVAGMTCSGCKASIENQLNAMDDVIEASVNLEKSEASITTSKHISIERFQQALPEKYTITEQKEKTVFTSSPSDLKKVSSDLKQLFPLFLIFLFITGASILLNYNPSNFSGFMLDFMGLFYIVFSFFKFLDLKGFPKSFSMYDPLAKIVPAYAWIYPFIELILGLMFLMRYQIPIALIVTLIVLGMTTLGVVKALLGKQTIQCACLGTVLKLPMTKATFIENSIMIIMAIIMLVKTNN
ncbi:Heavy-metal-associated domain-containing protein [Formosa sp. Hel1_31_208]|uniref:heavy-metal-associated domain-containing protein n=1 Tax=Formosa sp. Hel1_31_208 TaxID=1798225 RepID=UPI00087CE0AD|nr:heavy metal-associated domain-containing protein [Formosa sp. Hel1_31_208]SDR96507.1 Heavy-metal-associated domain-containing protein [Formosa sp. Hel1_31_208]